jgi:hypothetical protein
MNNNSSEHFSHSVPSCNKQEINEFSIRHFGASLSGNGININYNDTLIHNFLKNILNYSNITSNTLSEYIVKDIIKIIIEYCIEDNHYDGVMSFRTVQKSRFESDIIYGFHIKYKIIDNLDSNIFKSVNKIKFNIIIKRKEEGKKKYTTVHDFIDTATYAPHDYILFNDDALYKNLFKPYNDQTDYNIIKKFNMFVLFNIVHTLHTTYVGHFTKINKNQNIIHTCEYEEETDTFLIKITTHKKKVNFSQNFLIGNPGGKYPIPEDNNVIIHHFSSEKDIYNKKKSKDEQMHRISNAFDFLKPPSCGKKRLVSMCLSWDHEDDGIEIESTRFSISNNNIMFLLNYIFSIIFESHY